MDGGMSDLYRCGNDQCARLITEADMRVRYVPASRDEPGYDEPGCRHCAPDENDIERYRNARDERRLQEMREGVDL